MLDQVKLKGIACLSGSTDFGIVNGDRTASRLHCPEGICMMSESELLIADRMNNVVRRVDLVTGQVSTFAGCGDVDDSTLDSAAPVKAVNARLFAPSGVCVDPIHPGHAFISTDEHQRCIRQYSPADQTVRIVAGQASEEDPDSAALLTVQRSESGWSAVFSDIACLTSGVLAGSAEPLVYFTSMQQHVVRSYNPRTQEVRLVVGTGERGSSSEGRLSDPYGLAIDSRGRLVIGCLEGYQIVRFDPVSGSLEVLAGQYEVSGLLDGDGKSVALLGDVTGLSIDEADNIYFCDFGNHCIRMISSQGVVHTLESVNYFDSPSNLVYDKFSSLKGRPRLLVTDFHRVSEVALQFSFSNSSATPIGLGIQLDADIFQQDTVARLQKGLSNRHLSDLQSALLLAESMKHKSDELIDLCRSAHDLTADLKKVNLPLIDEMQNAIISRQNDAIQVALDKSRSFNPSGHLKALCDIAESMLKPGEVPPAQNQVEQSAGVQTEAPRVVVKSVLGVDSVRVVAGSATAGYQDGSAAASLFNCPMGLCLLDSDRALIADRFNHVIRQVDISSGVVSTLAGSGNTQNPVLDGIAAVDAKKANLLSPSSVCLDPSRPGRLLISTDAEQKCIHHYSASKNAISIVAGQAAGETPDQQYTASPPATVDGLSAVFSDIAAMTVGRLAGNSDTLVYISSTQQHVVRSYNTKTHEVRLVVGPSHKQSNVQLSDPYGLVVDSRGRLIISSLESFQIVRFDPSLPAGSQLEVLAGQVGKSGFVDGAGATEALLGEVTGLSIDENDTIYFCDVGNAAIRAVHSDGRVQTIVSRKAKDSACFKLSSPSSVVFDLRAATSGAPRLLVLDLNRLVEIKLTGYIDQKHARMRAVSAKVLTGGSDAGSDVGALDIARFHCPEGVNLAGQHQLWVADRMNNRVCKIDLSAKMVSTFAGCGDVDDSTLDSAAPVKAVNARLYAPSGVCADPIHPGHAFISTDEHQRCIRQYSPADQTVRIVAGQASEEDPDSAALLTVQRSESGSSAVFSDIACLTSGVLAGSAEPLVYFTSMQQHVVRSYNPRTQEVRLVVGTGERGSSSEGRLSDPYGLAIDSRGRLVIGCLEGYQIVRFDPVSGSLEVLAGQYEVSGLLDGDGKSVALLGDVTGLSIDEADNIYFCDIDHNAVRVLSAAGQVTTLVSSFWSRDGIRFELDSPSSVVFDRHAATAGSPRLFVAHFHNIVEIQMS